MTLSLRKSTEPEKMNIIYDFQVDKNSETNETIIKIFKTNSDISKTFFVNISPLPNEMKHGNVW